MNRDQGVKRLGVGRFWRGVPMNLPLHSRIVCVVCALSIGACCSRQTDAQVGNELDQRIFIL